MSCVVSSGTGVNLSLPQLVRRVNETYRTDERVPIGSIFNSKGTDPNDGKFRLKPLAIDTSVLTDEEKATLRKELQALMDRL